MSYVVKSKNKRGYIQESEEYQNYSHALHYAIECKESGQYSVIVILSNDNESNEFFLHRIIK